MERLIEESASVWNNDSQVSVSDHSTGTKGTAAAVQSGERDFTHIKKLPHKSNNLNRGHQPQALRISGLVTN